MIGELVVGALGQRQGEDSRVCGKCALVDARTVRLGSRPVSAAPRSGGARRGVSGGEFIPTSDGE